jgi:hypothetical protein
MLYERLRIAAFCLVATVITAHAYDNLMLDPRIAPARARVEAARKSIDDLRDHATQSDYRTIWVESPGGVKTMRRIPTEEFAARIERAEAERKAAEEALRALERSLD